MDYLSDLFLLWERTGVYWDETPYDCAVCGKTHKPRPGIVCRALMDKRLADHREAMAQLIKELGVQNERMVFCGRGYGKKAIPPKIVIGVDAGCPENSISKLRGVKAFLDEMNAAQKRQKKHATKCIAWERCKRLTMRQAKRQAAKRRKQAMRHPYWRGLPGKAKEALARNKYAHGSQQWAEDLVCSLAVGSDETRAMHWFSSDIDDPSGLWCWECAKKRLISIRRESPAKLIQRLGWEGWNEAFFQTLSDEELCGGTSLIDGGWVTEEDGPRHCDGCGCRLDHLLTDYGVDQELEYLEFHAPLDLRLANQWSCAHDAGMSMSDNDPRWHQLIKVVLAALHKRHGKPTRLCRNARLKRHRERFGIADPIPAVRVEVNFAKGEGSTATGPRSVLLLGLKSAAGIGTVDTLYGPDTADQLIDTTTADALFGAGSELARMYARFIRANPSTPCYAIATTPGDTPIAATGTVVLTGPATANGSIRYSISKSQFVEIGFITGESITTIGDRLSD